MTFNPLDRNGFIFAMSTLWQKITEKIDSLPVNGNPVGTVISFMGKNAPINYLKCDGAVYNISTYSVLANFFKSEFGSFNYFGGNGTTTFAVPDLRGEFLRGTGTATRDTGSGANVGTHQDGTYFPNLKTGVGAAVVAGNPSNVVIEAKNIDKGYNDSGAINKAKTLHATETVNFLGSMNNTYYTSKPTNTSVLYCIKYK